MGFFSRNFQRLLNCLPRRKKKTPSPPMSPSEAVREPTLGLQEVPCFNQVNEPLEDVPNVEPSGVAPVLPITNNSFRQCNDQEVPTTTHIQRKSSGLENIQIRDNQLILAVSI